jgi:hypothetical protein
MTWRTRLERLEAHAPPQAPELTPEERERRVAELLEAADRPDADLELRERAARVRALLALAEARQAEHERGDR